MDKINYYKIVWDETRWISYLEELLQNSSLSEKEIAYYKRINNVLWMKDLSRTEKHPIKMLVDFIVNSEFYKWFTYVESPEIVSEYETFDLFNFPEEHVVRRPSDSYFIHKSSIKSESILLRPHTTIAWYHYLINSEWNNKLKDNWEIKVLSRWKTYRVDELDKTHHECFHQIDWFKIIEKSREMINQQTLKDVLRNTIIAIFWDKVEMRFNEDRFPYTLDSLEVEVLYEWSRIEVLWAWIIHPTVFEKLWLDPNIYNGWAYWFWIERLVMVLKKIPDIRIFWSEDERIVSQWWNFEPYKQISNYPPVYKDISFLVEKTKFVQDLEKSKKEWSIELTDLSEADIYEVSSIIRYISWEMWDFIEEVKIIDIFENDTKFWVDKKSVCMRICFRSLDRTLTNEEINELYFKIRDNLENDMWYILR